MTSSNTNYTQLRLDGSSDPYGKIRTQEEEKIKARKSSFGNPFKKKYIPMPPDNNDSGKHDRSFGNRDYSYGYNSSSNNTRRYYSQSNQPNICYLLCCNSRTLIFFIYLVTLFAAYTLQPVTLKLMVDNMIPYRYPLIIMFSFTHCLICFFVSIWNYCFSSENVPPEMSKFKRSNIFFAAVLDAIQLTLLIISAGVVRGTLLVVLLQSIIPLRSLALAIYNSSDNLILHVISGLSGLLAILLSFYPFVHEAFFSTSTTRGGVTNARIVFWNAILLLISGILSALSDIYKKNILCTQPIDVYYFNGWVSFYQTLICIPLSPIMFTIQTWSCTGNGLGNSKKWGVDKILPNLHDGAQCMIFGKSSEGETCRIGDHLVDAHCSVSLPIAIFFLVINMTILFLLPTIIQLKSSTTPIYVVNILAVPLSYVLFELYENLDKNPDLLNSANDFTWWDVPSILMLTISLVLNGYLFKTPEDEIETSVP